MGPSGLRRPLPGSGRSWSSATPSLPATGPFPEDRAWTRLPHAARELRAVSSALRGHAELHAGSGDLKTLLTGGAAAGVPLLHLGTHAVADPVDPNRSRILFTAERGSPASQYLFWPEAAALQLSGVDLVTLSACDTDTAKMVHGESAQSFSRAFLAAGARSTVTTLWPVADAPTADFMQLFYRNLGRGEPKAEALRNAKLDFLRSGTELAQPRYWAAFVLNGDGRAAIPRVIPWIWICDGAVLLALLAWGYRYLRLRRARQGSVAVPVGSRAGQ